jgi:hypothetical protein
MRKVILVLAAIVLVASGVAAVSAYEAHVVNVKATVENALQVSTDNVDFGVVFPEEWLSEHFSVNFSDSFCQQERVNAVNITVWAEWKLLSDNNTPDPADDTYYPWLGEALYIEFDSVYGYIGPAIDPAPSAQPALDANGEQIQGTITKGGDPDSYTIYVWLDVPVFEEFYNGLTDVPDKPRAEWADLAANISCDVPSMILPLGTPQGIEMGVDLKIQVVDIWDDS